MKNTSSNVSKINDTALINDLAGKVFSTSRRRQPIIIAFFYFILKFLFSVGAYIPKVFLRSNLGERTFGIITILSLFIFFISIQIGIDLYPKIKDDIQEQVSMLGLDQLNNQQAINTVEVILNLLTLSKGRESFQYYGSSLTIGVLVKNLSNYKYEGLKKELKWFWWLILLLSLMQYTELFFRRLRENTIHSYHRGRSVFFSFLSSKKIIGLEIKNHHIWMVVEPVFIFLIAFIINNLGFFLLSTVLKIAAFSLFIEEYRVYSENRSLVLDIIDSLIDGKTLSKVQDEYGSRISHQVEDQQPSNDNFKSVIIE